MIDETPPARGFVSAASRLPLQDGIDHLHDEASSPVNATD